LDTVTRCMTDSNAATTRDPDTARAGLTAINALGPSQARLAFLSYSGSHRWASGMATARPYRSADAVHKRSNELFDELERDDWLQAFAAHAAIGSPRPGDRQGAGEQAAVAGAGGELLDALRDGNRRYRERFGHVFLIRARGRSAGEMLAALNERIGSTPEQELATAAQAQREITELRIGELIEPQ
jgi:OHCU decarboxylase